MKTTVNTTVQATTTANNAHFLPMTVYQKDYDSRRPGKIYAQWTTGEAYVVCIGNQEFFTGYIQYNNCNGTNLMTEKTFNEMEVEFSYESWETISFNEIYIECQRDLVEKMGSMFPWDASDWKDIEEFEEYCEPQTFEGKIAKSLRDRKYFSHNLFNSKELSEQTERKVSYEGSEVLLLKNGKFFIITSGFNLLDGYWAILEELSSERGQEIMKMADEREAQAAKARKEHARKCGAMARKYGIPFEISLRCFKGDEEDIKNFVESLKKAFGKNFDDHELSECGRARRGAEIERLGIEIGYVDPNHIAEYILKCLYAGEIVK